MLSYASNFEDVLLNRCFRGVTDGFYVDIGANHPTFSSVTRAFYDAGWSGINVEPGKEIEALRSERVRDLNIEAAVADYEGTATFQIHTANTGTSTLLSDVPPLVAAKAGEIQQKTVIVTTLASILDGHADGRHIHFLKIDAEGAEGAIVRGGDWRRHRPEVIVIESTEPYTNLRRTEPWQEQLLGSNYTLAYFDGINDFWVRRESSQHLDAFRIPVNVLDDFQIYNHEAQSLRRIVEDRSSRLEAANRRIQRLATELKAAKSPRPPKWHQRLARFRKIFHRA